MILVSLHGGAGLVPTVNYKAIVEEMRERLKQPTDDDEAQEQVYAAIRCRLAILLDVEPQLSMDALIDRLTEKWKRDGLL
jgi:hypothetical protein